MKINPCCCMTLQTGVKIMAILDIILDTLNVVSVALAITAFVNEKEQNRFYTHDKISATNKQLNVGIGALAFTMLTSLMALGLSVSLYFGAKKKELKACKKWLIITSIILLITLIIYIVNGFTGKIDLLTIISSCISVAYRLYMMWVVYGFLQELKTEGTFAEKQAMRTDEAKV